MNELACQGFIALFVIRDKAVFDIIFGSMFFQREFIFGSR